MAEFLARQAARLESRRQAGLYRQRIAVGAADGACCRVQGEDLVNFCSNDYLGLAGSPELAQVMQRAIADFGVGAGASHLVTGHMTPHARLEQSLAAFTGAERALVFSTGYMANLAVLSTFADRCATVVADRLNHASLVDGALLSRARLQRYAHNAVEDARRCLVGAKNGLLVSDSVFSMDGDVAPVRELETLALDLDVPLILDDAHGLGVLGNGRGIRIHSGLGANTLVVGTFGKALGVFGAFVAGPEVMIEALVQFARPYIYTTALPPSVVAAVECSLEMISRQPSPVSRLHENIRHFRELADRMKLPLLCSDTAIQPVMCGEPDRAVALSNALRNSGFLVSAIRPPTVPRGTSRLRITLSAAHSPNQIEALVNALAAALERVP